MVILIKKFDIFGIGVFTPESTEDYETIKIELATEVKKILQQTPKTWDKAKKRVLKHKGFIDRLLK